MSAYTFHIGANVRIYGNVLIKAKSMAKALERLKSAVPYDFPDIDIVETTTDVVTDVAVLQIDREMKSGDWKSTNPDISVPDPGHALGYFTLPFSALGPLVEMLEKAPRPLTRPLAEIEAVCLQQLALSTAARMRSAD